MTRTLDRTTHYRVQARLCHGLVVEAREAFSRGWVDGPTRCGWEYLDIIPPGQHRPAGRPELGRPDLGETTKGGGDALLDLAVRPGHGATAGAGMPSTEVQHRLKVAIDLLT